MQLKATQIQREIKTAFGTELINCTFELKLMLFHQLNLILELDLLYY